MVDLKINKTLRAVIIAVLVIVLFFVIRSLFPEKSFSEKYEGFDLSSLASKESETRTYAEYLDLYSSKKPANDTVSVDIFAYDEAKSYGTSINTD
ncbi:MAG: hypothetical protein IJ937_10755, partial [Treponema sp.]|nr:hypothetical protein [Treponema sp.]